MAKMKQTQELLTILKNDGWVSVFNTQSGIYYKNGYVLVYGDTHELRPDCVSMQNIFSRFLGEGLLGASDWFIEHDGFIIEQGSITPRLLDACNIGESDPRYKDWLKQINKIKDAVRFSKSQELQHRMTMMLVTTQGNVCKYVTHDGPVRDTLIFRFTRDIKNYKEGQIFKVVNVVDGKIQIRNVQENVSEVDRPTVLLDPGDYRNFEQSRTIIGVEPLITIGKVQKLSLAHVYDGPVAEIPKEFFSFNVRDRKILRKAVASCMNVTPLLTQNITITEELLEALANTKEDMRVLFSTSVDEESSRVVAQLIHARLNIGRFIQGDVDADYLQLQLHDFDYEFEAFSREQKFDSSQINLVREMYSYGVLDIEDDVFKQYVRFKGKQLGLLDTANTLISDGLITKTNVFMRWNTLQNKNEMYTFFSAPNLKVDGLLWSDWLSKIMNNGLYLAYDTKAGFILQVGSVWLGRDYNSLVFFDTALNPVWRAVKVNETFIQYGDFPIKYLAS